jgi:hypothetical protein
VELRFTVKFWSGREPIGNFYIGMILFTGKLADLPCVQDAEIPRTTAGLLPLSMHLKLRCGPEVTSTYRRLMP